MISHTVLQQKCNIKNNTKRLCMEIHFDRHYCVQILRWQIHAQLQLQSINVSNGSKWNFHVKSVAFAHHVVQQLCHERVFLRLSYVHIHLSTRGLFAINKTEIEHPF